MRQGKPCQIAKQMVIAGLKWPPDVEAQVIMAKAMPRANAAPGFEGGGEEGRELVLLFFFVGYGFFVSFCFFFFLVSFGMEEYNLPIWKILPNAAFS